MCCVFPVLQDLINYLRGETATVRQLDENVPLIPFEPPAKRQKVGGERSCAAVEPLLQGQDL
jgi:hypothetical protein